MRVGVYHRGLGRFWPMRRKANFPLLEQGAITVSMYQLQPSVVSSALLQPVRPWFVWCSIVAALIFELLPWGRGPLPDVMAVTLIFWTLHQPRLIGMFIPFAIGLILDVHHGELLGQNALAYTIASFGAMMLQRRILWFRIRGQIPYIWGLLMLMQSVTWLVHLAMSGQMGDVFFFVDSMLGAMLWPIACWFFLLPQRQPVQRDETRPL